MRPGLQPGRASPARPTRRTSAVVSEPGAELSVIRLRQEFSAEGPIFALDVLEHHVHAIGKGPGQFDQCVVYCASYPLLLFDRAAGEPSYVDVGHWSTSKLLAVSIQIIGSEYTETKQMTLLK